MLDMRFSTVSVLEGLILRSWIILVKLHVSCHIGPWTNASRGPECEGQHENIA
jgi:hypothetical protein